MVSHTYQTKLDTLLFAFSTQRMQIKLAMFILVDCNNVDKNDIGFSGCFPYGVNEGPCVFDDQCKDDIFCGYKNCLASFDDDANCCSRNQFKSPNYPNNFFTNDVKTWLITAPFGSIINLQFHSFHVRFIVESIYYR